MPVSVQSRCLRLAQRAMSATVSHGDTKGALPFMVLQRMAEVLMAIQHPFPLSSPIPLSARIPLSSPHSPRTRPIGALRAHWAPRMR